MTGNLNLKVQQRTAKGKGPNSRLRGEGLVPGVYYTREENIPVQMPYIPMLKAFQHAGNSQLLDLDIDGVGTRHALIKEIVFHPFKNQITHVDFFGVDMAKKLRVQVPLEVIGKAEGLDQGGIVDVYRDHIEIECLPGDIPENVTVDVTPLALGQNIHIADIELGEKIEVIFEDNFAVVGVVTPAAEEEEVEEVEEVEEAEEEAGEEESE